MNQYEVFSIVLHLGYGLFHVHSKWICKKSDCTWSILVLDMRSPHALRSAKFTGMRRRGGALVEPASVFKLMSTCLLVGRTNPAQIAKVRAQRNLRAALQILTWLGGRETGTFKKTKALICFNFIFSPLCACGILHFLLLSDIIFVGYATAWVVGLRDREFLFFPTFNFFIS